MTASLAPLPCTPIFHSWHLIQRCTPSSDPSYAQPLETKKAFVYSAKTFLCNSEIFISKLQTPDQNPLCFKILKKRMYHWRQHLRLKKQDTESMTNCTPSAGNRRNWPQWNNVWVLFPCKVHKAKASSHFWELIPETSFTSSQGVLISRGESTDLWFMEQLQSTLKPCEDHNNQNGMGDISLKETLVHLGSAPLN